ncbi:hypothetical protein Dsin_011232 [Dipteronia sinensis]|uniref:Dehydrin n=1 Tax=Dipteronia sinensis TaxID=43782 RepID=A0AAE0AU75_9ROSI|nr:hypothetical protein Dsin_011232 [Dipteronia sinensis]
MAHYQNQPGATNPQFDEHGNMVRQTDEAGFGSGIGTGTGTGVATGHRNRGLHGLHRDDGSSSSSSSEDEGTGIRKKKGMKEKIKEKIPGVGHKDDRPQHVSATTTPGGYGGMSGEGQYQQEHGHQKKGMTEKIKEKLPGQHGH